MTPGQFGVLGHQDRRDWPPLTADEARAVLGRYGLATEDILWHGQRPFSATGLVRLASGGRVFLKRHDRRLRDTAALAEEQDFAAWLAQQGVPVTLPLRTQDGARALERDGWSYEAYPAIEGTDRYRDVHSWGAYASEEDACAAGAMLGRVHQAARGYDAPARGHRPLISTLGPLSGPTDGASGNGALRDWAAAEPGVLTALQGKNWHEDVARALQPHEARLAPLRAAIEPLWGHGDWHGSNLFWDGAAPRVAAVMDFGMADRSCAAFDLAVAIERHAVAWLDLTAPHPVRFSQLAAFLDGYRTVRALSAAEKSLVIAFLPLCHVGFALSEVGYYGTLLGDTASATVAYDSYLLGHARWFEEDEGRTLLDWLARHL